jgi:hypothetical protein
MLSMPRETGAPGRDHYQLVIPEQLLVVRRLLRGEYVAAARRDSQLQRYQVRVRGHLGETRGPAAPSPNGIDPEPRRETWGLIESVRDSGVTIVLVTHFMEEAERLCDRVALIDQGRVVALGEPSHLAAGCDRHTRPPAGAGTVDASARRQTAHFEQFEPERLDLGQHAVERGLVGQRTSQHGLVAVRAGLQDWKRGAHRLAQAAADTDLVALRLRILARAAGLLTAHRRTRRMFRE